jgi:hypothetical protein
MRLRGLFSLNFRSGESNMKSPMVTSADYIEEVDKGSYSELKVMRSTAGWYVGTEYNDPAGFTEPGSRDSGYFATEREADLELTMMQAGLAQPRMTP